MLYNANEKFGLTVKFGDKAMALMMTEDDAKYIIRRGLAYAIQHNFGAFFDNSGKRLRVEDVTEDIISDGFYTGSDKKHNTLEVIMENLFSYALFNPNLLFESDAEHMPKETKPNVMYSMVDVKGFTERRAAEVLSMSA